MRLLEFFEWCAAAMIVTGIVLGLGKVAVDQIIYVSSRPAVSCVIATDVWGTK